MKVFYPLTKAWWEQIGEWMADDEIREPVLGDTPIEEILAAIKRDTVKVAGLFDEGTGEVRGVFVLTEYFDPQICDLALYCPKGLRQSLPEIRQFAVEQGFTQMNFRTRVDRTEGWDKRSVGHYEKVLQRMGFEMSAIMGSPRGWYIVGLERLHVNDETRGIARDRESVVSADGSRESAG